MRKKRHVKPFHSQQLKTQRAREQQRLLKHEPESIATISDSSILHTSDAKYIYFYPDGFGVEFPPLNINRNYRLSNIIPNTLSILKSFSYLPKNLVKIVMFLLSAGIQAAEYHEYVIHQNYQEKLKLRLNINANVDRKCEKLDFFTKEGAPFVPSIVKGVLEGLASCNLSAHQYSTHLTYTMVSQYFGYKPTEWVPCRKSDGVIQHCSCAEIYDASFQYLAELWQPQGQSIPEIIKNCIVDLMNNVYEQEKNNPANIPHINQEDQEKAQIFFTLLLVLAGGFGLFCCGGCLVLCGCENLFKLPSCKPDEGLKNSIKTALFTPISKCVNGISSRWNFWFTRQHKNNSLNDETASFNQAPNNNFSNESDNESNEDIELAVQFATPPLAPS